MDFNELSEALRPEYTDKSYKDARIEAMAVRIQELEEELIKLKKKHNE